METALAVQEEIVKRQSELERLQAKQVERTQARIEWDDLGEERSHVQAVFLEDANGWYHCVLAEVQAENLGGPAGDLIRYNVGFDG